MATTNTCEKGNQDLKRELHIEFSESGIDEMISQQFADLLTC
jgi:hypothetical protein